MSRTQIRVLLLYGMATIPDLHYQIIIKKAMKVDLGPRLAPYYSDAGWGSGSRFFVARRAAGPDGEGGSSSGGGPGGGSGQALCCVGVRNRKHGSAELMYMAVRCACRATMMQGTMMQGYCRTHGLQVLRSQAAWLTCRGEGLL